MAKVRISNSASYFHARHIVRLIFLVSGNIRADWLGETRPSATRLKLVLWWKEGFASCHIHIDTGFKFIPIAVWKSSFCLIFLGNCILLRWQGLFQLFIAWFRIFAGIDDGIGGLINIDMTVAIWIFLEVVLVIVLSHYKILQVFLFNCQRLVIFFSNFIKDLVDYFQILVICVINTSTVLGPHIISLFIFAGWIDNAEVMKKNFFEGNLISIISDMDGFRMTCLVDQFVLGCFPSTICIAWNGICHSRHAWEVFLHSPETSPC